jgi:hypothetical protein
MPVVLHILRVSFKADYSAYLRVTRRLRRRQRRRRQRRRQRQRTPTLTSSRSAHSLILFCQRNVSVFLLRCHQMLTPYAQHLTRPVSNTSAQRLPRIS